MVDALPPTTHKIDAVNVHLLPPPNGDEATICPALQVIITGTVVYAPQSSPIPFSHALLLTPVNANISQSAYLIVDEYFRLL